MARSLGAELGDPQLVALGSKGRCSSASVVAEGRRGRWPARHRNPDKAKLRHLQDTLYRKAKAEPGYRFWSLYGELSRRDLLEHALGLVARNGGAPGVDGESLSQIRATPTTQARWLDALQGELKNQTYRPEPVRRVFIPKSQGGQRPLGIPTVKDRVVQMAALLVLGPILEADFHPCSYGFRPRRNAHHALDDIVNALSSGRLEVVDADRSKYFDTIPHDRLMKLVARRTCDGSLLHLLRQWLDAPVAEERDGVRQVLPNRQGVPQGGVISPLLATRKIREEIRGWKLHLRSDKSLSDLARMFNPILRGWVQYYGHYYRSELHPLFRPLDRILVRWACRKYKKLRGHRRRATHWLRRISVREPKLWAHWEIGVRCRVP